jgi:putative transposase
MKRRRFTEEQVIAPLREYEAGVEAADLCHKYEMSNWKAPIRRDKCLPRG